MMAVILMIYTMNTGGYLFYGLAFYERIPLMECLFIKDGDRAEDWKRCVPE